MNITEGQSAPDFTLDDQDGQPLRLSSLKGSPVLIYFYPKDETPGCTTQARGIRDEWEAFTERGVIVLGVSPDDVASHREFCDNHDLPHTLLADPDHAVMEEYGAWGEKVLYGKTSVGVIRSSVLLDREGVVVKVWKRAQAKSHAERALKAIDALL
ncbi:thioredoxin-dependent thiol peroxidase [Euzebya tangerina]|uniref:thioredoxin-dependent thiol peroxidase n=1 Tax=Euzebya tangerina TaxID=591198 RepID=UPI00196A20CF|nr:thioredoxin-dependent thiol peroxidase [Euzebya tangerina]